MKKNSFLLLLALLILVGCVSQNKSIKQNQIQDQNKDQNQMGLANPASVYCEQQGGKIEIRTDAQGNQMGFCLFLDGSECDEWKFFRSECMPQNQVEDISDEIKQLFVEKYNKAPDEVSVTVNQQVANYARGGVKFGRDGIGEGGIFLVTKAEGNWKLVFDGNGMISCSLLEEYDFPDSMVTDCFDN